MPNENVTPLAAVSVLCFLLAACAHNRQIADLQLLHGDEAIEVQTKSGQVIILAKWALDGHGNIIGVTENQSVVKPGSTRPKWASRTIGLDTTEVIRRHKPGLPEASKLATIVVGAVGILATVYLILDFYRDPVLFGR